MGSGQLEHGYRSSRMIVDEWGVVRVVTKRRQYLITADSIEEALKLLVFEEPEAEVLNARFIGVYTLLVRC